MTTGSRDLAAPLEWADAPKMLLRHRAELRELADAGTAVAAALRCPSAEAAALIELVVDALRRVEVATAGAIATFATAADPAQR